MTDSWFVPYQMFSWYEKFNKWVREGKCFLRDEGLQTFERIIPPEIYYICLNDYMTTDEGKPMLNKNLRFTDEVNPMYRRLEATKDGVMCKRISNAANDGVTYLGDVRFIEYNFGPKGIFTYSARYLDFEQYITFVDETIYSLVLSIFAVLLIILVITADYGVTGLVGLCVLLTDMFIGGLIHYWRLTLNPIVVVNVIVAVGTSVDFSAHIAYSYLVEPVPKKIEGDLNKIRVHKAHKALAHMGSSVFHGGFSTFIAIWFIGFGDTYIFLAFYRLWFGIILFGMCNGFLLLPVVLSFIGPTRVVKDHSHIQDTESESEGTDSRSSRSSRTSRSSRSFEEESYESESY